MSKLLIDEPPLQVLPSLANALGLNEALFLQQLHYWLRSSYAKEIDGRLWIYNSYESWREQFPFWSHDTIKRIVSRLENAEAIETTAEYNVLKQDRTKWYTINYNALPNGEGNSPNGEGNLHPPSGQSALLLEGGQSAPTVTREETTYKDNPSNRDTLSQTSADADLGEIKPESVGTEESKPQTTSQPSVQDNLMENDEQDDSPSTEVRGSGVGEGRKQAKKESVEDRPGLTRAQSRARKGERYVLGQLDGCNVSPQTSRRWREQFEELFGEDEDRNLTPAADMLARKFKEGAANLSLAKAAEWAQAEMRAEEKRRRDEPEFKGGPPVSEGELEFWRSEEGKKRAEKQGGYPSYTNGYL